MSRLYLVRSAALTNYDHVARSVGLDPGRMLTAAGLSMASLSNPDLKVPVDAVYRLLEASAAKSGTDDFGLRLAETRNLSNFGPLGLAMKEEPTVRKALETLIRYFTVHNEAMLLGLDESDETAMMTVRMLGHPAASPQQAIQLSVAVFYRIVHAMIRPAARSLTAFFSQSPPGKSDVYKRVFNSRVEFGHHLDGIVFKARDLELPMPASDEVLAGYARKYLESLAIGPRMTMEDQVNTLLAALLPSGRCSVERIAEHLAVDRRTIHRKLSREGKTFIGLLTDARRDIVASQLKGGNKSLTEIAGMVGFSSLSSFSRWFTIHYGCSVTEWRGSIEALPELL